MRAFMVPALFSTSISCYLLALLFLAAPVPCFSQAPGQDSEAAGIAAEQAGRVREALQHYLAALRNQPDPPPLQADDRLRERIIKLVRSLTPSPAIPEEAERFSIRGLTLLKKATSDEDFDRVISEFKKALRVAPWWADAYINLALVQEKAGDPSGAIRSLKFYLLASPNAKDAREVRAKMIELEVEAEEVAAIKRLEGKWQSLRAGTQWPDVMELKSRGKAVTMVPLVLMGILKPGDYLFFESFKGLTVRGKMVRDLKHVMEKAPCYGIQREDPISASVSPDGKTMRLWGQIPSFNIWDCTMFQRYYEQEFRRISQ